MTEATVNPTPGGTEARTRADIWVDPACPWAWMTSRWLLEAEQLRDVDVRWHVMSLSVLNDGRDLPEEYRALMDSSWAPVRVLTAARLAHGDDVIAPLYDAIGGRIHRDGRGEEDRDVLIREALAEVGLPASLADVAGTTDVDQELRASHQEAMDMVGDEVGTPVVAVNGVGYFGPVMTPAPRGADAARLWDGLVLMTGVPGFYELKRTRTVGPQIDER